MALTPEKRKELFFGICKSKQELQQHIKSFLKIDLPNYRVDEDSNSTTMDFVWDVYNGMATGTGPTRFVVAASRNTAKTLSAAIIRFYGMVHFRRDGTHLAANLEQSQSANKYLDKFLRLPDIAEYVSVNNTRTKELSNLPSNSYTSKGTSVLRIAVATLAGVNSQRGSLNTKDEIDLIKKEILAESSFIADPTQDEHRYPPIEINLSSRKTATGPVQEVLDEAERGTNPRLKISKWSAVDWMQQCPPEIHKPEGGPQKAWINNETLSVTWHKEVYEDMPISEKNLQKELSIYEGCKTCPAFIVCQGRAPKQQGTSKMLRDIDFVSGVIDQVRDADKIIAQSLNWKPESSGMVFKMIRKDRHHLKPIEFYKFITGHYYNPDNFPLDQLEAYLKKADPIIMSRLTPSKDEIFRKMAEGGWVITYGVDWGFRPAEATCIVSGYHKRTRRAVVLHVSASQNYPNPDWADYIVKNIWSRWPGDLVCPDMADPASTTYFGKHRIRCLDYKPSRIETGVSQIRSLMWDVSTQESRFAILDDGEGGQNFRLFNAMQNWTHRKTPVGFDYSKFEDDNNCDYCFTPGQAVITKNGSKNIEDIEIGDEVLTHTGVFKKVVATMNRFYEGEVLKIYPFGREPIICTPEHEILHKKWERSYKQEGSVKLSGQLRETGDVTFKPANSLSPAAKNDKYRDSLLFMVNKTHDDVFIDMKELLPDWTENDIFLEFSKKKIKSKIYIDNHMAFFLGHFAAEGSCGQSKKYNKNGSLRRSSVQLTIHSKEKTIIPLVQKTINDNFGDNLCSYESGNTTQIQTTSRPLWSICKKFGRSLTKKYPSYVFNLNKEKTEMLLLGHAFGDGHFSQEGLRIPTISKEMAYQLLYMFSKVGLSPKIRLRKCAGRWAGIRGELIKNDQYLVELDTADTLHLLDKTKSEPLVELAFTGKNIKTTKNKMLSTKIKKINNGTAHFIRKIEKHHYCGLVYNISVEDDHSYTINGISVKNCDPTRYALAPFVEELKISASFSNKPPETNLVNRVGAGGSDSDEAKKIIEQKSELMSQVGDYFWNEHGVQNLFNKDVEIVRKEKPKKPNGLGIKFKFF
jgi:intein/homing endonuclease